MKKCLLIILVLFSISLQNVVSGSYSTDDVCRRKKQEKCFSLIGRHQRPKTRSLWDIIQCSYQNNSIILTLTKSLDNRNVTISITDEEGISIYEDNHLIDQQSDLQIPLGELEDVPYYIELRNGEKVYTGSF